MQLGMVVGALVVAALLLAAAALVLWRRELALERHNEPTPEEYREALAAMIHLAVEMCRADGQIRDAEIAALRKGALALLPEPDEAWVEEAIDRAMAVSISAATIRERARQVRGSTTRPQRVAFLELARAIATVDGDITESEQRYLNKLGGWFGFEAPKA